MPTEIVVETEDRPGVVASIGELFGQHEINITAAAGFSHGGHGYLHFIVDDADRAMECLLMAGWKVHQVREVLSVSLDDRPGALGDFARRMANAGINITGLYMTGERAGDKELIVAVDDVRSARRRL